MNHPTPGFRRLSALTDEFLNIASRQYNIPLEVPVPAATPENLDLCPATPEYRTKPSELENDNSSSSSCTEENGNGTDARAGNASPPPNCAICLGKCKNRSFTESCSHKFCFKCLLEWSKVKAECPLCKQAFKSIIHNVKSIHQFEEYLVQPQPQSLSQRISSFSDMMGYFELRIPSSNDFSQTVTLRPNPASVSNNGRADNFMHSYDIQNIIRSQNPDENNTVRFTQLVRRYIYDRKLYSAPLSDITGRYRESTARFYRENPAQMHRLAPWINRDLISLLRNSEHQISYVLSTINELLPLFNITSREFRRRIQPFLRGRASHFIHELYNFARSPFDMIGYDNHVRYNSQFATIHLSLSSSDSDIENIILDEDLTENRVYNLETGPNTDILLRPFEDGDNRDQRPRPPSAIASTSQSSAINLTTHNRHGEDIAQIDTNAVQYNICITSSSSDECEFVLEQKPPHLRTPEMVSLNSDSDSDVVFVQETKVETVPLSVIPRHIAALNRKRKLQQKLPCEITTDSSSEDETKEIDIEGPKKKKLIPFGANSNQSDTSDDEMADPTVQYKSVQIKDEYNDGASTSTGLRNGVAHPGTRTSNRNNISSEKKKFYGMPKMRHYAVDGAVKGIYEESSSDSEKEASDDSDFSTNPVSKKLKTTTTNVKRNRKKKKLTKKRLAERAESIGVSKKKKSTKESRKKSSAHKKKQRKRKPSTSSSSSSSSSTQSSSSTSSSSSSTSSSSESEKRNLSVDEEVFQNSREYSNSASCSNAGSNIAPPTISTISINEEATASGNIQYTMVDDPSSSE